MNDYGTTPSYRQQSWAAGPMQHKPQFSADTTDLPPFLAARRLPGYAGETGRARPGNHGAADNTGGAIHANSPLDVSGSAWTVFLGTTAVSHLFVPKTKPAVLSLLPTAYGRALLTVGRHILTNRGRW